MTFLLYLLIELIGMIIIHISVSSKKYKKLYSFILIVFLSFFIVARDISVGTDYQTYHDAIIRVASGNLESYDEGWLSYGFRWLISFISFFQISNEYIVFIVIFLISVFTLYFFIDTIQRYSCYPTLGLFIFFCFCLYFQMMNQFRQMFAISLVFYSIRFINKSLCKYLFCILVASSFHSTAMVMFPVYFVYKFRNFSFLCIFYFVLAILSFVLFNYFKLLISFTSYAKYLNWSHYDVGITLNSLSNLIVRFIFLFISLLFWKKIALKNQSVDYLVLYHFIFICTILQIISVNSNLFTRLTTYFFVVYILLIPQILKCILYKTRFSSKLIVRIVLFTFLLVYQIVYFCVQGSNSGIDHYRFIFG